MTLGNSVTNIGGNAFSFCDSLNSVTIPASVTTIGVDTFRYCDSLAGIHVDENNPCYSSDEYGVLFNKDKTELIQAPCAISGQYTIPASVNTIGNDAFFDCHSLTNAVIGDSVITIGDYAFCECDSLSSVVIGDSVTTIGNEAFFDCDSLTSAMIGDSVITIGDYAFYECDSLTRITFTGDAPSIQGYAFEYVTSTAYYPANNPTWTSDVMQDYGGAITWVPYTLDGNGDMIIDQTAAVTAAADPDAIPEETESENTVQLEFESEQAPTLNSVYPGDYSTEETEEYTLKTASFTGLVPNAQYSLLAMKNIDVDNPLAADNLLFIDQAVALEDGTLVFQYVQRIPTDISYVVACGASNKDLADAEITFPEMIADGEIQAVNPMATYDGKTLTEGQDYTIVGTVSFTEAGTYTCCIRGVRNYTGLAECTYQVMEGNSHTPGDINGDGNVNNRDAARLMQHLAGWEVEYVEAALDVNGDGKVSNRDAARLMQYLAGWDVEIN